jgi:hypothetical protein
MSFLLQTPIHMAASQGNGEFALKAVKTLLAAHAGIALHSSDFSGGTVVLRVLRP